MSAPQGHTCVPLRENAVSFLLTPWVPRPLTSGHPEKCGCRAQAIKVAAPGLALAPTWQLHTGCRLRLLHNPCDLSQLPKRFFPLMPWQPAIESAPVKPEGAGHVDINHVDINNVRPKIRQVVREGFKFAEVLLLSIGSERSWLVWQRTNGFWARLQPCRYRANRDEAFSPEGRSCLYPAAEME